MSVRPTRSAFTLIELLVVIAIIAILAAILFPVFAQAREKARATSCVSNLKQMSTSLLMYSQDYDEYLCPDELPAQRPAPHPQNMVWDELIQPYAKNVQIFACPDWPMTTNDTTTGRKLSYGMNYRLTEYDPANRDDAPSMWYGYEPISVLRTPAQTAWIMDNARVTNPAAQPTHREDPTKWTLNMSGLAGSGWNADGYVRFPQDPPDQGYIACCYNGDPWRPAPIHSGGTNTAFCDGHAKWIRTDQLVNPPRASQNCLYDNGSP
jgi:prepilin-type N-terminal cleavage/methylation domain-containing protein/prepilin-type processing-associated H-X9-DG protein